MWIGFSACSGADGDLPKGYRDVQVPSARLASPEAHARGRDLFMQYCALCHGERGDGRGERREGMSVPPADFTNSSWRARMTPRRAYFTIREGVSGTSMPSWKALDQQQTWDLVAYVLSLAEAS
jgi:high-affinity iron transporter